MGEQPTQRSGAVDADGHPVDLEQALGEELGVRVGANAPAGRRDHADPGRRDQVLSRSFVLSPSLQEAEQGLWYVGLKAFTVAGPA